MRERYVDHGVSSSISEYPLILVPGAIGGIMNDTLEIQISKLPMNPERFTWPSRRCGVSEQGTVDEDRGNFELRTRGQEFGTGSQSPWIGSSAASSASRHLPRKQVSPSSQRSLARQGPPLVPGSRTAGLCGTTIGVGFLDGRSAAVFWFEPLSGPSRKRLAANDNEITLPMIENLQPLCLALYHNWSALDSLECGSAWLKGTTTHALVLGPAGATTLWWWMEVLGKIDDPRVRWRLLALMRNSRESSGELATANSELSALSSGTSRARSSLAGIRGPSTLRRRCADHSSGAPGVWNTGGDHGADHFVDQQESPHGVPCGGRDRGPAPGPPAQRKGPGSGRQLGPPVRQADPANTCQGGRRRPMQRPTELTGKARWPGPRQGYLQVLRQAPRHLDFRNNRSLTMLHKNHDLMAQVELEVLTSARFGLPAGDGQPHGGL